MLGSAVLSVSVFPPNKAQSGSDSSYRLKLNSHLHVRSDTHTNATQLNPRAAYLPTCLEQQHTPAPSLQWAKTPFSEYCLTTAKTSVGFGTQQILQF